MSHKYFQLRDFVKTLFKTLKFKKQVSEVKRKAKFFTVEKARLYSMLSSVRAESMIKNVKLTIFRDIWLNPKIYNYFKLYARAAFIVRLLKRLFFIFFFGNNLVLQ